MQAAVEIYNKTAFSYREESFCLLMVNAWEILIKARIVQLNKERISTIYVKKSNGHYDRSSLTNTPKSYGLAVALAKVHVPQNARYNIETISSIRNEIAHIGRVHPDLARKIGELGTASVQNFIKLLSYWFKMPVEEIYSLPVAFIGHATAAVTRPDTKQQALLRALNKMTVGSEHDDHGYAVSIKIEVDLDITNRGGGTVGPTRDPNAPRVQVDDTHILSMYPDTYDCLMNKCKDRYTDFKQNTKCHTIMKEVKSDVNATYNRLVNPAKPQGKTTQLYNAEAVFEHLDKEYTPADGGTTE